MRYTVKNCSAKLLACTHAKEYFLGGLLSHFISHFEGLLFIGLPSQIWEERKGGSKGVGGNGLSGGIRSVFTPKMTGYPRWTVQLPVGLRVRQWRHTIGIH